ncbi:hypothetical protein PLICRDRAFT_39514 [Plicaturopsis crispa FD-325 SS-3]|nr:hypothetical protein PLICRDRAFT_39514 [Plicaturopsis crispa FD-325 SS-3]
MPMPRNSPAKLDSSIPCVSFIGIVDFSPEVVWTYCTDSVSDLLGWEPHEIIGRSSVELVHPSEADVVRRLHYETICQDKAAVLAYLRMKHKDPYKGYILCGVTRTVVKNVVVGSVAFATLGAKAMHNASTAQEVIVISDTAREFQFRRWDQPSPMPPCPVPEAARIADMSGAQSSAVSYGTPADQSIRSAFILNRFTQNCTIVYCSNNDILDPTVAMNRSFFDFVTIEDEGLVRAWIEQVKTWGVNERGQPSDGGFGFGTFWACPTGRDSLAVTADAPLSRRRSAPNTLSRSSSSSSLLTHPIRPHAVRGLSSASASVSERHQRLDAIFSAHSDGVIVILRPSEAT